MRLSLVLAVTSSLLVGAACTPSTPIVVAATPADPADIRNQGAPTSRSAAGWRIETREHVDLWLHGYAMLQDDVSLVPYYRPGYRAAMTARRTTSGSLLDANRAQLAGRLATQGNLASAQFLALYFASWDDLRRGVERFLRDQGEVRAARSNEELRMYATLGTYFPSAADRDWLRLFVAALDDERMRFYRSYWLQESQRRASVRAEVERLWAAPHGPAFARFMHNAMAREGAILLSLPLGGEGRTLSVGRRDNFVAVAFPEQGEDAREALYVVAHEVVGSTATAAVRDNASAAEERSGEAATWSTLAAVRGGAMLLERIAPEFVEGYQRYYLRLARAAVPATGPAAKFDATFPLPDRIRDALRRQIGGVLDGI